MILAEGGRRGVAQIQGTVPDEFRAVFLGGCPRWIPGGFCRDCPRWIPFYSEYARDQIAVVTELPFESDSHASKTMILAEGGRRGVAREEPAAQHDCGVYHKPRCTHKRKRQAGDLINSCESCWRGAAGDGSGEPRAEGP